jgi:hypothetical protein
LPGGSGKHLGQLDEIAEEIAEEGEAPADRGQLERLGHDGDAARAERLDGGVDAGHGQAEMMVAGPLQAIAEVGIGANILRGRITAAQDLDTEVVVCRGRDIGKLFVCIVPLGDDAKVELLDIPALGGLEIGGLSASGLTAILRLQDVHPPIA